MTTADKIRCVKSIYTQDFTLPKKLEALEYASYTGNKSITKTDLQDALSWLLKMFYMRQAKEVMHND